MYTKEQKIALVKKVKKELAICSKISEVAKRVGCSRYTVYQIRTGIRYQFLSDITIRELNLMKGTGKLCRKCGNPAYIISAKSLVCVQCELIEMNRAGTITLLGENQGG